MTSFTAVLKVYFNSLNLSLSPLLKASSFFFLITAQEQGFVIVVTHPGLCWNAAERS